MRDERYKCSYHASHPEDAEYYKCEDCQLDGVLEPDDIDQYGNRYALYKEYMEATDCD